MHVKVSPRYSPFFRYGKEGQPQVLLWNNWPLHLPVSVSFAQNAQFSDKSDNVEEIEKGGARAMSSTYSRRMSRRGSVLNPEASPPPGDVLVNSDRAYSAVA